MASDRDIDKNISASGAFSGGHFLNTASVLRFPENFGHETA
jgi:hypothetical protein